MEHYYQDLLGSATCFYFKGEGDPGEVDDPLSTMNFLPKKLPQVSSRKKEIKRKRTGLTKTKNTAFFSDKSVKKVKLWFTPFGGVFRFFIARASFSGVLYIDFKSINVANDEKLLDKIIGY